ncbi:MAG: hypothetical protein E7551_06340 [Ruminococcaceae bacterium]|nr:hypothetical protein [Oscillospiraceae bacterium]
MMRKIQKIGLFFVVFIALFFMVTLVVSAEEAAFEEELFKRQLQQSGAGEIDSFLPADTAKILEDLGINPENPETLFSFDGKGIVSVVFSFLTDGISAPLKTALSIIGILLIFASFEGVLEQNQNNMSIFVCFVASIVATQPIYSLMESVKEAIQSLSTFMLSLVPVYTGIMLSLGKTMASSGFSTLLLGASEVIAYLVSYLFVPISGAVMCLAVCGGISPVLGILRLSEWIKKCSTWAMGIATTIFLGILSLQNTFSSAADGLGIRASKAMLSSTIPIMGPAIAETISTARGCLNILRSGVGIYAVIAIGILALPVITELILWRFSMWVSSAVAEMFGIKQVELLLRSVDFCLSVLLAAVCFTALLFVIALAMTFSGG